MFCEHGKRPIVVAFSALTMRTPAVPAASIRGRSHAGPPVDFAHRRSLRN